MSVYTGQISMLPARPITTATIPMRAVLAGAVAALLIAGSVITGLVFEHSSHAAVAQRDAAQAREKEASLEAEEARQILAKLLAVGGPNRVKTISQLAAERIDWRGWLINLVDAVPTGVTISSMSASPSTTGGGGAQAGEAANAETGEAVTLTGSNATRQQVQQFVVALRRLSGSTGAQLVSATGAAPAAEGAAPSPPAATAPAGKSGGKATQPAQESEKYSFQITTGIKLPTGGKATAEALPSVRATEEPGGGK